jgi:hypothetical protein
MVITATETIVLSIIFLPKNINPSIISGILNNPYNKPTDTFVNELIIVAMPVTPPGAMFAGAIKQCKPTEKTDAAITVTNKSSINLRIFPVFFFFILFFVFFFIFFVFGIINHLELVRSC